MVAGSGTGFLIMVCPRFGFGQSKLGWIGLGDAVKVAFLASRALMVFVEALVTCNV